MLSLVVSANAFESFVDEQALLHRFTDPFIYILIVAVLIVLLLIAAIVMAFISGQTVEGVAIVAVIVIYTVIGFFTEWRAVRSMEACTYMLGADDEDHLHDDARQHWLDDNEVLALARKIVDDESADVT